MVTFPRYKPSNVCNQFSLTTSFRAIKIKKSILSKKNSYRLVIHNYFIKEHVYEIRIGRKLLVFELHIPILTLTAKNYQDLQLQCHK
jgi:hypothetical protein